MKQKYTIYHGSDKIIEKPVYGLGNPKNDYGLGFYCTEHIELAKEWSCTSANDGIVNQYSLNTRGLTVLDFGDGNYNILNWLAVLLENRTFDLSLPTPKAVSRYLIDNFLPDYKDYDVIIGYRADDAYFSFASAFVKGLLGLDGLNQSMYLGDLGYQVVLKSKKAFDRIRFEEYEKAPSAIYLPKRKQRDDDARTRFRNMEDDLDQPHSLDIVREGWKNEDSRIPTILRR